MITLSHSVSSESMSRCCPQLEVLRIPVVHTVQVEDEKAHAMRRGAAASFVLGSSMTRKVWVQNHVLRKGCGTMVKLGGRQSWTVGKLAGDFKDLDRARGGGPYL